MERNGRESLVQLNRINAISRLPTQSWKGQKSGDRSKVVSFLFGVFTKHGLRTVKLFLDHLTFSYMISWIIIVKNPQKSYLPFYLWTIFVKSWLKRTVFKHVVGSGWIVNWANGKSWFKAKLCIGGKFEGGFVLRFGGNAATLLAAPIALLWLDRWPDLSLDSWYGGERGGVRKVLWSTFIACKRGQLSVLGINV